MRALIHLLLTALLGVGCVNNTVYQRALRLQDAPAADEIEAGLGDRNWKLRCLAARACGTRPFEVCLGRIKTISQTDDDENVRSCAGEALISAASEPKTIESLERSCSDGGRGALLVLAEVAGVNAGRRLRAALVKCPTADAILAVEGLRLSGSTEEQVRWLEEAEKLPEPKAQVRRLLLKIRNERDKADYERHRQEETMAQVASEKERARAEMVARADALLSEAKALAESDRIDEATDLVEKAKAFGATDVSVVERAIAAAPTSLKRKKEGERFLSQAVLLAKKNKTDEALTKVVEAEKLGVERSPQFIMALDEARERQSGRSIIETELPVQIGQGWVGAMDALNRINCQFSSYFGNEQASCRLELKARHYSAHSIDVWPPAGLNIGHIAISAKTADCKKAYADVRELLVAKGWTVGPVKKDGGALVLAGSVGRDRTLRTLCVRLGGPSASLQLIFEDAWMGIPTPGQDMFGNRLKAGWVISDRIMRLSSAAKVVPPSPREMEDAINHSSRSAKEWLDAALEKSESITDRSKAALTRFRDTVTESKWLRSAVYSQLLKEH